MTDNLDRLLRSYVDSGLLPMVSARVSKNGMLVYSFDYGKMQREKSMQHNAIFRICSITKLFSAVAMLQLIGNGKLNLNDEVKKYIPSFRGRKVLVYDERGNDRLEDEKTACTIRHLMTMTSGIPNYDSNASQVSRMYAELYRKVFNGSIKTTKEVASQMGTIPAQFEPGTHFQYGLGFTVCGAIVEIITKMGFAEYLEKKVFEPIGMKDTGFFLSPKNKERICSFFSTDREELDRPTERRHYSQPTFIDGSDGAVSTMDDLILFADMLQEGLTLRGERILQKNELELMRTNQMNAKQLEEVSEIPIVSGYGYGLGVRTLLDPSKLGIQGNIGEFGWYGHGGTWIGIDPVSKISMVFGSQIEAKVHIKTIPAFYNAVMAAFI